MNSIDIGTTAMPAAPECRDCLNRLHCLRFVSLFNPGKAVVVPCDEAGHVDLDALSDRLKNAYLGARALVGRDYAYPFVDTLH